MIHSMIYIIHHRKNIMSWFHRSDHKIHYVGNEYIKETRSLFFWKRIGGGGGYNNGWRNLSEVSFRSLTFFGPFPSICNSLKLRCDAFGWWYQFNILVFWHIFEHLVNLNLCQGWCKQNLPKLGIILQIISLNEVGIQPIISS